ncbi:hypothetical protein HK104_008364 [Borealophlyctis nickersoniae]|nr:hypothetical protein HK104_008364 [Borealophlyctis nickersoniae]
MSPRRGRGLERTPPAGSVSPNRIADGAPKRKRQDDHTDDDIPSKRIPGRPIRKPTTKYFIMKPTRLENVRRSQKIGLWCIHTDVRKRLRDAYHVTETVILFFTVEETRHFQGYAKMTSNVGEVEDASWEGKQGDPHNTFSVEWLKIVDVPERSLVSIRNKSTNDYPVTACRDGQEVHFTAGVQVCALMDQMAAEQVSRREADPASPPRAQNKTPPRPDMLRA